MAKSGTFTVSTPVQVDISLDSGTVYRLNAGLNHDVPEEVAHHWYAEASGCKVVDLKPEPSPEPGPETKPEPKAEAKVESPPEPRAEARHWSGKGRR